MAGSAPVTTAARGCAMDQLLAIRSYMSRGTVEGSDVVVEEGPRHRSASFAGTRRAWGDSHAPVGLAAACAADFAASKTC